MKSNKYLTDKRIDFIIISIAIVVSTVAFIIVRKSFWYLFPYIGLEAVLIFILMNFYYSIDNDYIKIIKPFFFTKTISIQSIYKIVILEKHNFDNNLSSYLLDIYYENNRKIQLSPIDTVNFIEAIELLNPDVEII